MKLLGITGQTGAGKSTHARYLNRNNDFTLVEVDKEVHDLLRCPNLLAEIATLLGSTKPLDRRGIGEIVFANPDLRDRYNHFIKPKIESRIDDIIYSSTKPVILDWALLPLSKYYRMCEYKILVQMPTQYRRQVVMRRDNICENYFNRRDAASLQYTPADFDTIHENTYNPNFPLSTSNIPLVGKAFFAGSFDPFTNGHLDIVKQALADHSELVIGLGQSEKKQPKYPRQAMKAAIEKTVAPLGNVRVVEYQGTTAAAAIANGCNILVRGIRDQHDQDYEGLAERTNLANGGIGTKFYYPSTPELDKLTSTYVRNLTDMETIKTLVPVAVYEMIDGEG